MWNPADYLSFADHRNRPFVELTARIFATEPRRIVDLGCGPGNSTATLADRWPNAVVDAIDSSPDMVAAARANGVSAAVLDVREWSPTADTDIVVANAALQWIPEHRELLARWPAQLSDGAVIAVQMPGNFDAPSHRIIRELATTTRWAERLASAELRPADAVDDPAKYVELMTSRGCSVDAWETTYIQRLAGTDPVLDWVSGTALTPIYDVLDADERDEFRADLAPRLTAAYPPGQDGVTSFPFRRVFVVAVVSTAA
ncbi:MAG: trans-aconitate 2-methyltransferase [Rhodococcus sp. (in: high G+C Gram-positive bacteria)]